MSNEINVKALIAERDALAAELAELEGQEPVAYIDNGTGRPHWYPGALPNNLPHGTKLYARPVPAEQPVNARLLAAARAVVARWETPNWKDAPATAGFIYELRDAIARAEAALTAPQPDADGPWKDAVIDQLVISHIFTAEHESNPRKAIQDLLVFESDIAVDPRVSGAAAKLVEQARAEEREACAKVCEGPAGGAFKPNDWWAGFKTATTQCADAIRSRGQG